MLDLAQEMLFSNILVCVQYLLVCWWFSGMNLENIWYINVNNYKIFTQKPPKANRPNWWTRCTGFWPEYVSICINIYYKYKTKNKIYFLIFSIYLYIYYYYLLYKITIFLLIIDIIYYVKWIIYLTINI